MLFKYYPMVTYMWLIVSLRAVGLPYCSKQRTAAQVPQYSRMELSGSSRKGCPLAMLGHQWGPSRHGVPPCCHFYSACSTPATQLRSRTCTTLSKLGCSSTTQAKSGRTSVVEQCIRPLARQQQLVRRRCKGDLWPALQAVTTTIHLCSWWRL